MELIEFFSCDKKHFWLDKLQKSDWSAGKYLFDLLKNEKLKELCGESTTVWMLTEADELYSFCTLAEKDDIQPTELTPWIGFVYTFPLWRKKGYCRILLNHVEQFAAQQGFQCVYISTDHTGLYEKYGYSFRQTMPDIEGNPSRVYQKFLS